MPHSATLGTLSRPDRRFEPMAIASARRTAALAGQVSFAQRIMESSACPIMVIDTSPDALIDYVSPALEIMTGYAADELLGRPWTLFFVPAESDAGTEPLAYEPRGAPQIRVVLAATHKNGAVLHLDAAVTSLRSDAGLATHRILVLRDVTAERLERSRLEHRAHHDPLTELANRHLLRDRFELAAVHARRHDEPFAIVMIDLDGFKQVNDRLGHDAGDALLKSVGRRLKQAVRAEDTVARLGGDEFVLLVTEARAAESIPGVLSRIRDCLRPPLLVGSREIAVGCCAGFARFPEEGTALADLLKVADGRLYSEKARRAMSRDHAG